MKPSYRTTADDLMRTLRNLRLDILETVAAGGRNEKEGGPPRGKPSFDSAPTRKEKHR